jgi:hypothetical protein
MRLTMAGRIRVGPWLSFSAEEKSHGHDFTWEARAGLGRFRPLHVVDRYTGGRGGTEGRILGRVRFLHADDENTARSAAGRAAVESIWVGWWFDTPRFAPFFEAAILDARPLA